MKKPLLSILFIAVLVLTLTACKDKPAPVVSQPSSQPAVSQEAVEQQEQQEEIKQPQSQEQQEQTEETFSPVVEKPKSESAEKQPTQNQSTQTKQEERSNVPSANASDKRITANQAKKVALNHAGFTESQVKRLKVELDRDDGITYYEVDFYAGDNEYEYKIHAIDKSILQAEKNDISLLKTNKQISSDKAISIALNHCNIKRQDTYDLSAELDGDVKNVYEVSFESNFVEYEYRIDALTGEILRHHKELD